MKMTKSEYVKAMLATSNCPAGRRRRLELHADAMGLVDPAPDAPVFKVGDRVKVTKACPNEFGLRFGHVGVVSVAPATYKPTYPVFVTFAGEYADGVASFPADCLELVERAKVEAPVFKVGDKVISTGKADSKTGIRVTEGQNFWILGVGCRECGRQYDYEVSRIPDGLKGCGFGVDAHEIRRADETPASAQEMNEGERLNEKCLLRAKDAEIAKLTAERDEANAVMCTVVNMLFAKRGGQ